MDEDHVKQEMSSVIDLVSSDIATIRTGRASPSLVEDIIVNAYGGTQKLKVVELAAISSSEAETIIIDPWDKSIIGEIKKAIAAANIGLNPVIDKEIIRISYPPLTTEDRAQYIKLLKTKLEQGKVMIRRIRSDAMRDIKKAFEDKALSEDEKFGNEKRLQELTDSFIEKIDTLGAAKEKELLGH